MRSDRQEVPEGNYRRRADWSGNLGVDRQPCLAGALVTSNMQDPESLRKERQNLKRALNDTEAEEATGQIEGNREEIKELLILRIAEIDRLLGDSAD